MDFVTRHLEAIQLQQQNLDQQQQNLALQQVQLARQQQQLQTNNNNINNPSSSGQMSRSTTPSLVARGHVSHNQQINNNSSSNLTHQSPNYNPSPNLNQIAQHQAQDHQITQQHQQQQVQQPGVAAPNGSQQVRNTNQILTLLTSTFNINGKSLNLKGSFQAWKILSLACSVLVLILIQTKHYEVSTDLQLLLGIERLLSSNSSPQEALSSSNQSSSTLTLNLDEMAAATGNATGQLEASIRQLARGASNSSGAHNMLTSHIQANLGREFNGRQMLQLEISAFVSEFRSARSTLTLSSLFVGVYVVSWFLITLAINDAHTSNDISMRNILLLSIFGCIDFATGVGFIAIRLVMYSTRNNPFASELISTSGLKDSPISLTGDQLTAFTALRLVAMRSSSASVDVYVITLVTLLATLRLYAVLRAISYYKHLRRSRNQPPNQHNMFLEYPSGSAGAKSGGLFGIPGYYGAGGKGASGADAIEPGAGHAQGALWYQPGVAAAAAQLHQRFAHMLGPHSGFGDHGSHLNHSRSIQVVTDGAAKVAATMSQFQATSSAGVAPPAAQTVPMQLAQHQPIEVAQQVATSQGGARSSGQQVVASQVEAPSKQQKHKSYVIVRAPASNEAAAVRVPREVLRAPPRRHKQQAAAVGQPDKQPEMVMLVERKPERLRTKPKQRQVELEQEQLELDFDSSGGSSGAETSGESSSCSSSRPDQPTKWVRGHAPELIVAAQGGGDQEEEEDDDGLDAHQTLRDAGELLVGQVQIDKQQMDNSEAFKFASLQNLAEAGGVVRGSTTRTVAGAVANEPKYTLVRVDKLESHRQASAASVAASGTLTSTRGKRCRMGVAPVPASHQQIIQRSTGADSQGSPTTTGTSCGAPYDSDSTLASGAEYAVAAPLKPSGQRLKGATVASRGRHPMLLAQAYPTAAGLRRHRLVRPVSTALYEPSNGTYLVGSSKHRQVNGLMNGSSNTLGTLKGATGERKSSSSRRSSTSQFATAIANPASLNLGKYYYYA